MLTECFIIILVSSSGVYAQYEDIASEKCNISTDTSSIYSIQVNLDALEKSILSKLETIQTNFADALEKKILHQVEKIIESKFDAFAKNITQMRQDWKQSLLNFGNDLFVCSKKVETLEKQMLSKKNATTPLSDVVEDAIIERKRDVTPTTSPKPEPKPQATTIPYRDISAEYIYNYLGCNKAVLEDLLQLVTPAYKIDELRHVERTALISSNIFFKMHFSISTSKEANIYLSSKSISENNFSIGVGYGSNDVVYLYKRKGNNSYKLKQRENIPDILSAQRFTDFYITIDNGTLQFGMFMTDPYDRWPPTGTSEELLKHYDEDLKSIRYISFRTSDVGTIFYDCPY